MNKFLGPADNPCLQFRSTRSIKHRMGHFNTRYKRLVSSMESSPPSPKTFEIEMVWGWSLQQQPRLLRLPLLPLRFVIPSICCGRLLPRKRIDKPRPPLLLPARYLPPRPQQQWRLHGPHGAPLRHQERRLRGEVWDPR
jgi:hypothetical protein